MANIITLYHGTIYEFDKIDVTKGKGNKDFGRGFYASHDIRHAERLATRNKFIEEERFALRGVKKASRLGCTHTSLTLTIWQRLT